ncbi:unnamed protein product [Brassicogethes aeneus]|uniref:Enkurin domain-containing protein n=1 Tax=Brassicogethes aeneus TaxID=1431903 RepID=A0A9P0FQJ2_BRAAE|nr:unnamed protein product [Brassicogethes aeneus]
MNSTTLRGVFPEPKPVHRRNFIKENVKQIKQMQGILQDAGIIQPKQSKDDRFKNIPTKNAPVSNKSHRYAKEKSIHSMVSSTTTQEKKSFESKSETAKKSKNSSTTEKFTHRSMQTEKNDDVVKLYETGVIKFARTPTKKTKRGRGQGDTENVSQGMENLDLTEGRDFVRENMKNIKPKHVKQVQKKAPSSPHEAGQLPKYIRDKKEEEAAAEVDQEECPPGYVLLPEEDRKITLRNLRQSYADRIQELNSMPVRSDTLRMRKRKMEIEEELKKIDGGIKIFQRPKVYVKIND